MNYSSRDFESIRQEIIALINAKTGLNWQPTDYNDLGNVIVEAIAYLGDMMSYYIDRASQETSVSTAVKTSTLLDMARLYGYIVSGPNPAQVELTFTNNGDSNVDLPIGTQVMAPLVYGPYQEVYFETTELVSQLAPGNSITVAAAEGKTVNTDKPDLIDPTYHLPIPMTIGTTDGTANQTLYIYDTNIVNSSIRIYVGQGVAFSPWSYISSLIDAGPQDHVFTTEFQEDGTLKIIFGDGSNGMIPSSQQLVGAVYKTSFGISGNIASGAVSEITFIPGNPDLTLINTVSVTNTYAALGGADADDLEMLRTKVIAAVNTQRRAVTLEDYINLALQVPLVGKANAVAGVWSSVSLYVQPKDDGTYTPGVVNGNPTGSWNDLSIQVTSALEGPTLLGTTVTVLPPAYVPIYVTASVIIDNAYKQSDIVINIRKAMLSAGGFFSYANNTFGKVISAASIISAMYAVPGVLSAVVTALNTDNGGTNNTVTLNANQIPYMIASNLIINPTGGHA